MARQDVLVDPGLVVEAVQVSDGGQVNEVAIPLEAGRQEHEVKGVRVKFRVTVHERPRGDVGLYADDGVDAGLFGPQVELDHPIHRPVVGDRYGRHAQLLDPGNEGGGPAMTVEEAVRGGQVQVDEWTRAASPQGGS